MRVTAQIKLVSIYLLAALFMVMAALPANAKGRKGLGAQKAQKEIMAIKWNCDTKGLAKLDQLIKEGTQRRLHKKDLDVARYRHVLAKQMLNEKDKALCLAALQSGGRILAFAKQKKMPPARVCADVMKNIQRKIARGDEANAPAKKLFDAEAKYASAQKALKLKGRTNAASRNTFCLKHADAANKVLADVERWIRAKTRRCKKDRSGTKCSKPKKSNQIDPSKWLVCNTKGFAALQVKIERWRKDPKAPNNIAKKALADAKKHRAARQWPKCMARLDAGKAAFKQVESEARKAEKKWQLEETKRLCNAGSRAACRYLKGTNPWYRLPTR